MDTPLPQPAQCRHHDVIAEYALGDMSDEDRASVEAHIVECSDCRGLLASYIRFISAPETPDEAAFLDNITPQTAEKARRLFKDHFKSRSIPAGSSWRPTFAMAASIAAIALLVAFVVWNLAPSYDAQLASGNKALQSAVSTARPTVYRLTGFAYSPPVAVRGAAPEGQATQLAAAAATLASIVEQHPTAEARHILGKALILQAQYADAVEELERANAAQPDSAAILTDLAVARAGQGTLVPAVEDLNRALEVAPKFPEAIFNRALVNERLGRYPAAKSDWEVFLTIDATSEWATEARQRLSALDRRMAVEAD